MVGKAVGVTVGLNVNVGRVGVGAADVAGCEGVGFGLADVVADGVGAGGAVEVATAATLVVGCAPMGSPPDGSVLVGSAPLVAVEDWLDCPGWAAAVAGCRGCEPVSAIAATIPVAVIAITTAATAAVMPDSASTRRLGGLIGSGKPFSRNGPARCVTSCR
jgi:hypothetical protein